MDPRYETFRHEADAWTVGQLRASLDGVPDDWPIVVGAGDVPPSDWVTEQVVTYAAPWSDPPPTTSDDHFYIGCELPSGDYIR